MTREVLKQALEALLDIPLESRNPMQKEAIPAIKEALAQPDHSEDWLDMVAAEREACAKLVEPDDQHKGFPSDYLGGEDGVELLDCIAAKIRARGQA